MVLLRICVIITQWCDKMTENKPDEEVLETLTVKVTPGIMQRLNSVWRERHYPSRSEYVRHVLRKDLDLVVAPE